MWVGRASEFIPRLRLANVTAATLSRFAAVTVVLVVTGSSAHAQASFPDAAELTGRLAPDHEQVTTVRKAAELWFTAYRASVSRVRGNVCNFDPSCSHYSQEAISELGFLRGIAMTGDRLIRCNHCLNPGDYPRGAVFVEDRGAKLLDLPEDHDMWWWFEGRTRPHREGLLDAAE